MRKLKADWQHVHALNAPFNGAPPVLRLGASEIAYIAHMFVMGDVEVRACASAIRVETEGRSIVTFFRHRRRPQALALALLPDRQHLPALVLRGRGVPARL